MRILLAILLLAACAGAQTALVPCPVYASGMVPLCITSPTVGTSQPQTPLVAYPDVPYTDPVVTGWTSKPPITPPVSTIDPQCGTALHGDKGKCVAQVYVVRHRGERCTFTRVGKDAYLVDCAWREK